MGRLTLNILLSFAEFERQMIADRTQDKMAAARRKGKWVGGRPVLGYDVAANGGKLVVNVEEARQVQSIFALYLQHRSLDAVLTQMQARLWTKRWRTRDGFEHLGRSFTKPILVRLLRNVVYLGKVSHEGAVYAGEHEAIVEPAIWSGRRRCSLKSRGGLVWHPSSPHHRRRTGVNGHPWLWYPSQRNEYRGSRVCWPWHRSLRS
jgi:site-specific DNA recombinase